MSKRLDHMGEEFDRDDDEVGDMDLTGIWINFFLGWFFNRWPYWVILLIVLWISFMLIGKGYDT